MAGKPRLTPNTNERPDIHDHPERQILPVGSGVERNLAHVGPQHPAPLISTPYLPSNRHGIRLRPVSDLRSMVFIFQRIY